MSSPMNEIAAARTVKELTEQAEDLGYDFAVRAILLESGTLSLIFRDLDSHAVDRFTVTFRKEAS